jgi:hypothetical protein
MEKNDLFYPIQQYTLGTLLFCFLSATPSFAAGLPTLTGNGVVTGTMDINFETRAKKDTSGKLAEGSPAEGTKDEYVVDLKVAKTTAFSGKVERQPRLFSKVLGREVQAAQLKYDLNLLVLNPANLSEKKEVGKWIGGVPIDENGKYQFGGDKASPLRIVVNTVGAAQGFTDQFGGTLINRENTHKKGLVDSVMKTTSATLTRWLGGKEVKMEVKNLDPMRFENLTLAAGPAKIYPTTTVNGSLDFDYETGNYYANGVKFVYSLDDQNYEDVMTGTIKWEEDEDRSETGKGRYIFNLRFNETKHKVTDESAAFDSGQMSAEEAFFAVDKSLPALTGQINYVDVFGKNKELPVSSKITFDLNANQLTKQQVMNFFKLWLACIGPTNDE